MISIENISFSYNSKILLDNVSFEIEKGNCIALVGPSGCGKSTLANIIAGHINPRAGRVMLNNNNVTGKAGRHVFLVNQENDLFPWQNVLKQIYYAQTREDKTKAQDLINMVKLTGFEYYYPEQLSGGMKKRLSIARAIAVNPELIIFDESFSSLDSNLKNSLLRDLKEIRKKTQTSIMMISHNERDFENLAVKKIFIEKRY